MDWQQWLVMALFVAAAIHVGRIIWREVRGLLQTEDGDLCPGCGECGGESDALAKGRRSAPQIRVTPLVKLSAGKKDDDLPASGD